MVWILLFILIVLFLGFYCWFIEPNRFQFNQMVVQLPWKIKQPITVLHLSDLHFYEGRTDSVSFLHSLALHDVDLIFITGDLIEANSGMPICIEALKPLRAKHGIYAVFGNHDYFHTEFEDIANKTGSLPKNHERKRNDTEQLKQELTNINIQVLQNNNTSIEINGQRLFVVGIDDPYVKQANLDQSFEGVKSGDPCLGLVHSPEIHEEIAQRDLATMVFCGHTHGGQIRLPWIGALLTRTNAPRRFVFGLQQEKNTVFYISTGIGTGRFTRPRFNCLPEAVLFTLIPKE
jgi:predicted MPP superfamily phosphohydrolase